jgi:translation initiation factor 2 beta subunit (eIF-2beta)/eIF-5
MALRSNGMEVRTADFRIAVNLKDMVIHLRTDRGEKLSQAKTEVRETIYRTIVANTQRTTTTATGGKEPVMKYYLGLVMITLNAEEDKTLLIAEKVRRIINAPMKESWKT